MSTMAEMAQEYKVAAAKLAMSIKAHQVAGDLTPAEMASLRLSLRDLREAVWAAGCPRCRAHLLRICASAGFTPRIHHTTDDYVVVQALVAQGLAVAALPASSLDAHAHPGVTAVDVPGLGARTIEAVALPGIARVPSCAALLAAVAVTVLACLIPVKKAADIEPAIVLRGE